MDHDGSTAITIHADLIGDAVHLSDTQLGTGWKKKFYEDVHSLSESKRGHHKTAEE